MAEHIPSSPSASVITDTCSCPGVPDMSFSHPVFSLELIPADVAVMIDSNCVPKYFFNSREAGLSVAELWQQYSDTSKRRVRALLYTWCYGHVFTAVFDARFREPMCDSFQHLQSSWYVHWLQQTTSPNHLDERRRSVIADWPEGWNLAMWRRGGLWSLVDPIDLVEA